MSDAQRSLAWQCRTVGLLAVEEFRFAAPRRWRFDLAWPEVMLACEVDGGGFVNGRHSRGRGIENDCEKISQATALGWRVMRVTPGQIKRGEALRWIELSYATCLRGMVPREKNSGASSTKKIGSTSPES